MSIDVPFKGIPQTVLDEIGAALQHYFVPILGLISEKPTDPLNLVGSGTLVRIGSGHYILTAAHVWDAVTHFPSVGLSPHHLRVLVLVAQQQQLLRKQARPGADHRDAARDRETEVDRLGR
jgi:hypothetical protein